MDGAVAARVLKNSRVPSNKFIAVFMVVPPILGRSYFNFSGTSVLRGARWGCRLDIGAVSSSIRLWLGVQEEIIRVKMFMGFPPSRSPR
jgi:hypothetical protein